jgi:hypothetical protein
VGGPLAVLVIDNTALPNRPATIALTLQHRIPSISPVKLFALGG